MGGGWNDDYARCGAARLTDVARRGVLGAAVWLHAGCSDSTGPDELDDAVAPAGADVTSPFPIDRGDDAGTPGTYKGLWLRLAANDEPVVTAGDGVIGLVCIGMSNGNQECVEFIQRVRGDLRAK